MSQTNDVVMPPSYTLDSTPGSTETFRMPSRLSIGAVARAAAVSVDTVRYYERRGLLPRPPRGASGYRAYEPPTIDRIRFAKHLQGLGFTLDEVVALLRDVDRGSATCAEERPRFAT